MNKKVKIFIIVIVLIVIIIAVVSYFGNKAPVASTTGLTSSAAQQTSVLPGGPASDPSAANANNFLAVLSTINGINLDTSVFSNPGYLALQDNPVILGTAVIGRQNPFAPIGSDPNSNQPAPILQLQTLAPGKIVGTSAELGALVTVSSATPVSIVFQYGTSDNFGSATAPVSVTKSGTALLTLTGLTPSTTYYVEAVAVQGSVTATGSIMSFTTTAALH